jgi:TonB family protein
VWLTLAAPRLPRTTWRSRTCWRLASLLGHAATLAVIVGATLPAPVPPGMAKMLQTKAPSPSPVRVVFMDQLATAEKMRGGGGGGNRRPEPPARAEARGSSPVTLLASPHQTGVTPDRPPLAVDPGATVFLDALPLASGTRIQPGLPEGTGPDGSQGQGSGGGVGTGVGRGIGDGDGAGLGPGSGGGTGGGVYTPGGGVTAPVLLTQVRPAYTPEALRQHLQGTVVVMLVVRRDGTTSDAEIVRSLDPSGLDVEAVRALRQWRFAPGRLNGAPVDVRVSIVVDFRIF